MNRAYRSKPLRRAPLATALLVAFLTLTGVASATPVAEHDGADAVTIASSPSNGANSLIAIGRAGQVRTIWSCPHDRFCGDLLSVAWAPDGRHLALSLTELGGLSLYPGLHIIDTATGHDTHVIGSSDDVSGREVTRKQIVVLTPRERRDHRKFGCLTPEHLAWSPDGSQLAYTCMIDTLHQRSRIHIMDADGSRARVLRTGTKGAAWPSWSPSGKRIVFATATVEQHRVPTGAAQTGAFATSVIYTIGLDGHGRKRIAEGTAPIWSPDGATIAYRSTCGRVRLVRPNAADVTPAGGTGRCAGIGPQGWPEWAPGGGRLALATSDGVYLIDADGTHLTRISGETSAGVAGVIRPAWQPAPRS